IRAIFAERGEPAFRALERDVMAALLGGDRLVIAAGGGAVLDPAVCNAMRAAGPVVWLRASVETIERRIAGDDTAAERRPNLTPEGGRTEIETVLAARTPLYRGCATIAVDIDGRTIDQVVEQIVAGLPSPNFGKRGT